MPLVSTIQLKRVARKTNSQAFIVFVTETPPLDKGNGNLPQGISSLLQEFSDIFPDKLPKELPQERNIDHRIVVEPRTRPTHRIPYKLSHGEKEEVEKKIQNLLEQGLDPPSPLMVPQYY